MLRNRKEQSAGEQEDCGGNVPADKGFSPPFEVQVISVDGVPIKQVISNAEGDTECNNAEVNAHCDQGLGVTERTEPSAETDV